jgi:hypothetical protein
MADPERGSERSRVVAESESTAGTPRWVKVSAVIALLVVVLFVVVLLVGGGEHGPGRHSPGGSDTATGHTGPPRGMTHSQP